MLRKRGIVGVTDGSVHMPGTSYGFSFPEKPVPRGPVSSTFQKEVVVAREVPVVEEKVVAVPRVDETVPLLATESVAKEGFSVVLGEDKVNHEHVQVSSHVVGGGAVSVSPGRVFTGDFGEFVDGVSREQFEGLTVVVQRSKMRDKVDKLVRHHCGEDVAIVALPDANGMVVDKLWIISAVDGRGEGDLVVSVADFDARGLIVRVVNDGCGDGGGCLLFGHDPLGIKVPLKCFCFKVPPDKLWYDMYLDLRRNLSFRAFVRRVHTYGSLEGLWVTQIAPGKNIVAYDGVDPLADVVGEFLRGKDVVKLVGVYSLLDEMGVAEMVDGSVKSVRGVLDPGILPLQVAFTAKLREGQCLPVVSGFVKLMGFTWSVGADSNG